MVLANRETGTLELPQSWSEKPAVRIAIKKRHGLIVTTLGISSSALIQLAADTSQDKQALRDDSAPDNSIATKIVSLELPRSEDMTNRNQIERSASYFDIKAAYLADELQQDDENFADSVCGQTLSNLRNSVKKYRESLSIKKDISYGLV